MLILYEEVSLQSLVKTFLAQDIITIENNGEILSSFLSRQTKRGTTLFKI